MNTKALRQKILDLAIHGKLVPQDPNDEPASVLLERIRAEKEQLIKEGKIKKPKKTKAACDKPRYEYEEPFDIPDSWETASMSDLFLLNPKSEVSDDMDAGFIPMALVEDGFSGKHSFEIREWGDIKKGYCHFQTGDIGVAKISPCFENLKSCIFECLPNNIGAGTTELVILRSLGVYAPFYLYLLKSQWYISQGTKYFKGVVGQQRVNKEIFTDLMVQLPPIEEQKRIVEEVNRLFGIIDAMERGKSDLQTCIKQAKSKILDLAIHGKLVPQDPNNEPAAELLKRINPKAEITCDTPRYQNLPKGWCETILGNVISIKSGDNIKVRDNRTGKYPIYGGNGVTGYNDSYNTDGTIIIIGRVGFYCGSVHYVDGKVWVTDNAFVTTIKGNVYTEKFLYYLLQQCDLKQYSNSTAQPVISGKTVYPINVVLPPLSEQHRIVAKIEELFTQLDKIESSL